MNTPLALFAGEGTGMGRRATERDLRGGARITVLQCSSDKGAAIVAASGERLQCLTRHATDFGAIISVNDGRGS